MLSSQKKKQRESPSKKAKSGMFLPEITSPTEEDKGVFGDVFNLEELIYGDDENKNSDKQASSTRSVPIRKSSQRAKD